MYEIGIVVSASIVKIYVSLLNQTQVFKFKVFDKSILKDKRLLFLLGFIILLYVAVSRYKILGFQLLHRKKYNSEASDIYLKSVKLMKKEGFTKPDYLTTTEFSDYILKNGGDRFKKFEGLTSSFNQIKYGGDADKTLMRKLKAYYHGLSVEISKK